MIKKYINKICFIILNILVLIIFIPWLKGHYATDTYNIMNVGYEYYSIHNSLIDGRMFMFLIMQFASILNIKCEVLSFILLFLALLVSNISVLIVKKIVFNNMENKNIKSEIFSYIIAYTFIYNFMYIENLYFLECFVMSLAILLNLMAAKIFEEKKQKYLLKTILLTLISVFCYQGTISSLLIFVILFEMLKKQPLKNIVKNFILAVIIVGAAIICNLVFIKIISKYWGLQQTRLSINILYNIVFIFLTKLQILFYTSNNFYCGLFLAFLIILIGCFGYAFKFNENKEKYFSFFMLLVLGIFCTDLPYLVSLTAYTAGRTRFAIGALCSIIVIYILSNSKEICKKHIKQINYFLSGFMVVYFMLNLVNYLEIVDNTKIANQCEKEYVENIDKYISEYERENNTVVEKIQLVYAEDANNAFYSSCKRKNVMTWNACSCSWSAIGTINFYTNKNLVPQSENFIEMEMDEMYEIKDGVLYIKIGII